MKISQLALALCAAAALTPSAALRGDHRRAETDSIEADKNGSKSRSERTCGVNVGDTLYTSASWVAGRGGGGLPDRRLQEDTTAGTPVTADNAYSEEIGTVWFPVFKFVNEDAEKVCVYYENIFAEGCRYRRHLKEEEDRNLGVDEGFCAVPENYIDGARRYERKLSSYSPEELQHLQDTSERKLFFNDCGMELVGFMTADAAQFGVQYYDPCRRLGDQGERELCARKLGEDYYDESIPAASIDLNFLCLDDKDIGCALFGGNGRGCKRGLSNIIKGSISASGLGARGAPFLFGEEDGESEYDYEPYGMGQFGITGGTNSFNNIQGGQINMDYVAPNTMRFEITGPTAAGSD